jgi:hypothetical protein
MYLSKHKQMRIHTILRIHASLRLSARYCWVERFPDWFPGTHLKLVWDLVHTESMSLSYVFTVACSTRNRYSGILKVLL